jgi:hypothetical protein
MVMRSRRRRVHKYGNERKTKQKEKGTTVW